jgi:hypothetical protein
MGWQDPSPRARARSPAGDPAAQPGYGDPGVRLPFMTIVVRAAVALLIGGLTYAGAYKGFGAWLGPAHALAVLAVSAALAVVLGGLVLRALMRLPASDGVGIPFADRRGWGHSAGLTLADAADLTGDVVDAFIDAATD